MIAVSAGAKSVFADPGLANMSALILELAPENSALVLAASVLTSATSAWSG